MAKSGKPFSVDTRPTKEAVVNSLTRDLTVEACVLDLIDNAIDAARETALQKAPLEVRDEMDDSFDDFEIKLTLNGSAFEISDNCGGIPIDHLKKMVLRFGWRSKHEKGIGIFGVGLNRALFKLGRSSHLVTDTGSQRAELTLKAEEYLEGEKWTLPAEEFPSTGEVGTRIKITQLPTEIANAFADAEREKKIRSEIGHRYARFIAKGLSILVNGEPVENQEVKIRADGPYEGGYKFYKTDRGVSIHIVYGQHAEHRFTKEPGYDPERNRLLTDQYGWTILCNDRAIIISDRTFKTGWDTFHSEYYGFVGFASFMASDPAELPWNTTKVDVDLNNPAYQSALVNMRHFAEKWRSLSAKRKKSTKSPHPVPKPKQPTHSKPAKTKKSVVALPVSKLDHNQSSTVLPDDVDESLCFDKHLALVHEGKLLDLSTFSYSGLAVIRMLFECTVIKSLERSNKYADLVQFAIEKRKASGMKLSAQAEKELVPGMDEMLKFLTNNPALWGAAKENHLKHSLSRMTFHSKMMNSAVHNPFQQINRSQTFQIRDELLPALRHLIEK
jgi:hypothetical protein